MNVLVRTGQVEAHEAQVTHQSAGSQSRGVGNIATGFLSGGTPTTSRADYWKGEIPWITSKWLGDKLGAHNRGKIRFQRSYQKLWKSLMRAHLGEYEAYRQIDAISNAKIEGSVSTKRLVVENERRSNGMPEMQI